jgi:hypothetical protein
MNNEIFNLEYKNIEFLKNLFFNYLDRDKISNDEIKYHLNDLIKNKSMEEKELEFKTCKERIELIGKKILSSCSIKKNELSEFDFAFIDFIIKKLNYNEANIINYFKNYSPKNKICINYSGHVRNYNSFFENTNNFFLKKLKADIFIHTWDDYGFQNKDTSRVWLKNDFKKINFNDINQKFKPKKILIENQSGKIDFFSFKEEKTFFYFDGQAKDNASKYINAQLYSIYKSNLLKLNYENENKILYDLCIRIRFDFYIDKNINLESLCEILYDTRESDKILYIANPINTAHGHPGGGGGCKKCEDLYKNKDNDGELYSHKHGNDICDIIIIGSSKTMNYYSSLYFVSKKIYDENSRDNDRIIKDKNIKIKTDRNMCYILTYHDIENHVFCYYPEKLLRKYLEGYVLLNENVFHGKIKR